MVEKIILKHYSNRLILVQLFLQTRIKISSGLMMVLPI